MYNYKESNFKLFPHFLLIESELNNIIIGCYKQLNTKSERYKIIRDDIFNTHKKYLEENSVLIAYFQLSQYYKEILLFYSTSVDFLKNKMYIDNEECNICMTVKKLYKLYNCPHYCCFDCYNSWSKKTCSICREK